MKTGPSFIKGGERGGAKEIAFLESHLTERYTYMYIYVYVERRGEVDNLILFT